MMVGLPRQVLEGVEPVCTYKGHGSGSTVVRSRHGLVIHPNTSAQAGAVDHMLPPRGSDTPARSIDTELAQIAARYGRPTADIVALIIEYPWVGEHAPVTH